MGNITILLYNFSKVLRLKKSLIIILLSIFTLNILLYSFSDKITFPKEQRRLDASGFTYSLAKKFSYFYYYTGNFPLSTQNKKLNYSKNEALKEISKNGKDLIMEYYHWSRLGEHARILAFLPDAWLNGSPQKPSIHLFNTLIFILGLSILYLGFWYSNKASLGLLIVILINTTPFYLFEIFINQNIFGLLGSTFFIILGLNVSLILLNKRDLFITYLLSIMTGVIIGFFSEFRNEVSITLLSAILIYFLANSIKFYNKIALIIIVIFSFNSVKKVLRNYFNTKFEETVNLVGIQGGHVYNGAKISGHNFWHPLFCGLGDFDTKYGYEWNDLVAYKYAIPTLNRKYKMNLKHKPGQYHLNQYYDDAKKYYIKPEELEHYETVMKEKVLYDIKNDPLWYAEIIWKRVINVLTKTLPYSYLGFLGLPLLYYLFEHKKWNFLKLILISLPLSATSIIIYSGKGTTYNSMFGYFIITIILYELSKFFKKISLETTVK